MHLVQDGGQIQSIGRTQSPRDLQSTSEYVVPHQIECFRAH